MNVAKLVGQKRLAFLAMLCGTLVFFMGVALVVLTPMLSDAETQLASVNGSISSLGGKISSIKKDIKYMQDNIPRYNEILAQGMFNKQDRFDVERLIDEMKKKAGVVGFSYNISDLEELENAEAAKMGYVLVKRSISLTAVKALLDLEVYSFFQRIKEIFPVYTQVRKFKLERTNRVNQTILEDIASGKENSLVDASMDFDWVTLVEKKADGSDLNAKGAGRNGK